MIVHDDIICTSRKRKWQTEMAIATSTFNQHSLNRSARFSAPCLAKLNNPHFLASQLSSRDSSLVVEQLTVQREDRGLTTGYIFALL